MTSTTLAGSFGDTAIPTGFLARIDSKIATCCAASSVSGPRNSRLDARASAASSMPLRASTQYGLFSDFGQEDVRVLADVSGNHVGVPTAGRRVGIT